MLRGVLLNVSPEHCSGITRKTLPSPLPPSAVPLSMVLNHEWGPGQDRTVALEDGVHVARHGHVEGQGPSPHPSCCELPVAG